MTDKKVKTISKLDSSHVEEPKVESKITEEELLEMEQALKGGGMQAFLKQYKSPGFITRLVSDNPKNMAKHTSLGYTNVLDEEGSTVRVSSGEDSLILMKITEERHAILRAIEQKRTDSQMEGIDPQRAAQGSSHLYV